MLENPSNDRSLRASQEASFWLERLERVLKPDEGPLLRKWLKEPLHRKAILNSCKLWHGPEILAVLLELIPDVPSVRPSLRRRRLMSGFVFVVFCLVLLSFVVTDGFRNDSQFNSLRARQIYQTPVGVRRKIDLPDGSTMILNSATRVFINYGPHSRDVKLVRGEASFSVNDDRIRQFLINTGMQQFEAYPSSRFNLHRITMEKVELTVLDGQVRALPSDPDKRSTLTPAQIRARPTYVEHTFSPLEGGDFEGGWNLTWKLTAAEVRQRLVWQQDLTAANDR